MVQGYYSLKEAAEILGMAGEQLNRMAQKREIRAFADGGSWKFRTQDVDELKRSRQYGSDPDIKLPNLKGTGSSSEDEQIMLDATAFSGTGLVTGGKTEKAKPGSSSDVRLVLSDSGSEAEIKLVPDSSMSKGKDSSLDATAPLSFDASGLNSPSDSDVRLALDAGAKSKSKSKNKSALERTEEIHIDPKLLESTDLKLKAQTEKQPVKEKSSSDSEIEFNFDDDLGTGFKVEGDSDFSLASLTDFDANDPSFAKKKHGSTHSLEKTAGIIESDDVKLASDSSKDDPKSSDSEFELSLESDEDIFATDDMPGFKDSDDELKPHKSGPIAAVSSAAAASKKPSKPATESSDSDFELAIDEDFEVEEESGSDVVAIDDEEESEEAEEEADDFDDDFGDEVSPVAAAAKAKMAAAAAAVGGVALAPAPWPAWSLAPLVLTTLSLGFIGMMMFEVMRNSLSYTQPYALDGTVIGMFKSLAGMVGLGK